MSYDYTQIKNITVKFDRTPWNPNTHNIVLFRDPKSTLGFSVRLEELAMDLSEASSILQDIKKKAFK